MTTPTTDGRVAVAFGSHFKVDFPHCLYIRRVTKFLCFVMTSALKVVVCDLPDGFNEVQNADLHGDGTLGVLKKLDDFVRLVDAELDAATEGDAGGVVAAEE